MTTTSGEKARTLEAHFREHLTPEQDAAFTHLMTDLRAVAERFPNGNFTLSVAMSIVAAELIEKVEQRVTAQKQAVKE